MIFASVAEFVNLTLSKAKVSHIFCASCPSSSFTPPKFTPLSNAFPNASRMTGWECPNIPAVYSPRKSIYSLPSTEVRKHPLPLLKQTGKG